MSGIPVLWLYDPAARQRPQGKSEIGWEILLQVQRTGLRAAYTDLPHFGFLAPVPGDDPENTRLKVRNIAALWPAFAADGAQCVIIFSSAEQRDVAELAMQGIPGAVLTYCEVGTAREILAGNETWPAPS